MNTLCISVAGLRVASSGINCQIHSGLFNLTEFMINCCSVLITTAVNLLSVIIRSSVWSRNDKVIKEPEAD